MKRFLITVVAVISAQILLFCMGLIIILSLMGMAMLGGSGKEPPIPSQAYLVQTLAGEIPEFVPEASLPFPKKPLSHTAILENLEKARVDDRIAGVVLKLEMPAIGWGKLYELRERVKQLREAGKPVYAYATFATTKGLCLGAACDSFFVQPGAFLFLTGLNSERFYMKKMFEKLDIDYQVSQIKEYKSMAEMVLRSDMSPQVRENTTAVLTDLYDDMIATLASDRGVERRQVELWFDIGQLNPEDATSYGLVDGSLLWEDLAERLRDGRSGSWSISGKDYAAVPRAKLDLKGDRIAVVHGLGTITSGESGWVFPVGATMGDETMVQALERTLKSDRIKGVLLRLDTGGGLSTASDRIGQMVERVAREKPVVVSMVDITASGGYMVSYRCSTLVATPSAIVGSIGSISMRADMTGLMGKLGITIDRATVGPHATALSGFAPFTDEEYERFEILHWKTYNDWVAGIADHRGYTAEEIDALARGRIFTGRQALDNGLIDVTGGFDDALALLKELADIPADQAVTYTHLPREKDLFERLAEGDFMVLSQFVGGREAADRATPEQLGDTLHFWEQCLSAEESLALCPWRF